MNTYSNSTTEIPTNIALPNNHPSYAGVFMNSIGTAYQNTPVLLVKPILLPYHQFSEHNPLTNEKTNVFTTISVETDIANVRLYRLKYDIVMGYDDPKTALIQEEVPEIVKDLQIMYENTLFNGLVDEYGFKNNSKTKLVTFSGDATSADAFVAFVSSQLESMIQTFGRGGTYTLTLPLGWYQNLTNIMGVSGDDYIVTSLKNRATRLSASLSIYDSDIADMPYLIYTPAVLGFFGAVPYLAKTINDDRREEHLYRFMFDTPAVVITKQNAVVKMEGLTPSVVTSEGLISLQKGVKNTEPFATLTPFKNSKGQQA